MKLTRTLVNRRRTATGFDPEEARILADRERTRIHGMLFSDGAGELLPYLYRVATLTGLSAAIAAMGLIENSTAVVIGAMLISPLMQPIIGLAAALVGIDRKRQLVSLGLIVFATLESVGVGALVAVAARHFRMVGITPEILQRTTPGVLDLAIACAAGAAGAYVTVRHQALAAFPGAAIAVALMPPLATAGILLERGNGSLARGAFLLFMTNLLGIVVSSALVLWLAGFAARRALTPREWITVSIPLLLAIGIAYPLERQSSSAYRRSTDEALASSLILPRLRLEGLGIQNLTVLEQKGRTTVSVDVAGPEQPTDAPDLAKLLADKTRRPVTLIVRYTPRNEITALANPSHP